MSKRIKEMKIKTKTDIGKWMLAVSSLFTTSLLVGCATSNTSQIEPKPPSSEVAVGTTTETVDEFSSVTIARENAVSQADELALLEESLDAATQEEPLLKEVQAVSESTPKSIEAQTNETSELAIEATNNSYQDDAGNVAAEVIPETIAASESTAAQNPNIWHRVRAGFALPDKDHPEVKGDKNWYAKNQSYINRTFERAEPYFYHIVEQIEARGMPLELALLPVVESAYQPFAYSHGRAAGLWQFIPGTARRFGLKIDWWYDGRRDVKASTTAALDYLEALHKRFDGDWLLALAAYNSGEGTVSKAIRKNKSRGKGTTFWDLKLPRETEGYVPKLLAISSIVADPTQHGINLNQINNTPYLAEVDIGSQLDLAIAADMAEMKLEELYTLNPAFNRWATSPDGPHRLLLPLDKSDDFSLKLAELPKDDRVKWVRHRIKEGETLGHIAMKYKTTVKTVKTTNKIRGNIIRAGNYLIIPAASQSLNQYALSEEQRLRNKQNMTRSGTKISYTVSSGDTLWDISMAHRVSVRQLAAWNGMAPRDTLRPGQKLVIWNKPSKSTSAANPLLDNPLSSSLTQKINYRVRNGDSLARISQRFNVSVAKLKQWNPSARGKYIQPGQRLVVYVDVTKVSENI